MRSNLYFHKNGCLITATIGVGLSLTLVGCTKPKAVAAPPVAPGNSAQKLSTSEIETRIKAVQDNKTLPESAKPSIIQSIRAQGQP